MKAKFKDLIFNSYKELNKWLKENTFKVITLKDYGQDMQKIWVHESGEILYCDFHGSIYIGKFIDMKKLVVGNHLNIWDDEKNRYIIYSKLFVEELN